MSKDDSQADHLELISFRIAEQEFCLDIMAVREIRGGTPATPLPHSPPYVRGGINLRGAVLPILGPKVWVRSTTLPLLWASGTRALATLAARAAAPGAADLAKKARRGLGPCYPTATSVIIVVHIGSRLVGLLVDAVSEILASDLSAVQPTPNVGCDSVGRFVRGIIAQEGRMISWIAIDEIMPNDDLSEAA